MNIFLTLAIISAIALASGVLIFIYIATNPLFFGKSRHEIIIPAQSARLQADVQFLTSTSRPRTYDNLDILESCIEYIRAEFAKSGGKVELQSYRVDVAVYRNVICSFGPPEAPRLIIGAHYDVCGAQPGADDNASGIAGLLELARLLGECQPELAYRVDLVAYPLEEPPFFRTDYMGSAIHARSLYNDSVAVKGMICLEMIGYFSDAPGSQEFPMSFLKLLYPDRGNFIALVGNLSNHGFVRDCKKYMTEAARLDVRSINAPAAVPGIDLSDHLNYWRYDYPALMVTDTAFYRNQNYHYPDDTIDTLDFDKMAEVIRGVYWVIVKSRRD